MHIEVRIGLWHDAMAIQVDGETADALLGHWGHLGVNFGFLAGRTVYIESSAGSKNHFREIDPGRSGGDSHRANKVGAFNLDLVARCRLHPVSMSLDPDTNAFLGDMAPCHELPWPELHERCKAYYGADEVFRQIMLRRRSAVAAGIGWARIPRLPPCFRDLIGEETAKRVIDATDELIAERMRQRAA